MDNVIHLVYLFNYTNLLELFIGILKGCSCDGLHYGSNCENTLRCYGVAATFSGVCNGHGQCVYKTDKSVQCSCDEGYGGTQCGESVVAICNGIPASSDEVCSGRGTKL